MKTALKGITLRAIFGQTSMAGTDLSGHSHNQISADFDHGNN